MAVIYDLLRKKQLKRIRDSVSAESEYFTWKDHISANESSSYANYDDIELFRVKPVEIRDIDDSSSAFDSDDEDDEDDEYGLTSYQNEESKFSIIDQENNDESISSEDELNIDFNDTDKIKNKFKANKKSKKLKHSKLGRNKLINEKKFTMQSLSKQYLLVDKAKERRK